MLRVIQYQGWVMRIRGLVVWVALSCAGGVDAASAPPPGYDAANAGAVQSLPVHIVARQATVRPQVAYAPMDMPTIINNAPYPGTSWGQTTGINVAAGLIAGLIINGSEYAAAKSAARERWNWLQAGKCTVDADTPVRAALEQALRQAGMAGEVQSHLLEKRDLDDVVNPGEERLVVQHSTSFTPDLGVVLTSVSIAAWPKSAEGGKGKSPAWQNMLMVASAPVNLPAKTDQDTQALLQVINQAYADSGNDERVEAVNKAGRGADIRQRNLAIDGLHHYQAQLRAAKRDKWIPETSAARRALFWTSAQCAPLQQAVQDNAEEMARLVGALYAGQLPTEGVAPAPALAAVGEQWRQGLQYERESLREVEALAPSAHLSRLAGTGVLISYAYRVLDAETSED